MLKQSPQSGVPKLISDPFHEWNLEDATAYSEFGDWLDHQLQALELRYAGWETLGYRYWRSSTSPARHSSHQSEAEAGAE